jgi:hypothetical protein
MTIPPILGYTTIVLQQAYPSERGAGKVKRREQNMSVSHDHPRPIYEIQVRGELDQGWENCFNDLAVTLTCASEQPSTTTLIGPVADQAALRGMLCKLWDLNLTLISVRRIEAKGKEEHEND